MKSVLITGGSGSFGQAFTKFLLGTNAERIVIYSRGEHAQEDMARRFGNGRIRYFIGDVRDKHRLSMAMHGIDTVVHAAALKIVPIAEYNPTECIATNIRGAENVVLAAITAGVKKVIALSTDKAVNPINLYGATKLCAEKIFIAANNLSAGKTLFSVVRYGNVVGSQGSVLPLFKKIAAEGGSLPITDTRMTRFWIRMDEAISLINLAHAKMVGREIFIPKIPSVNIVSLAEAISPKWHECGIRPGEKLHEVLISEDEVPYITDNNGYYVIHHERQDRIFRSAYASDTNSRFLETEQLRKMIHAEEGETSHANPKD
jgi:UDP-N-acetylglucosamine 4,6-dehydratase/5-epimerase